MSIKIELKALGVTLTEDSPGSLIDKYISDYPELKLLKDGKKDSKKPAQKPEGT